MFNVILFSLRLTGTYFSIKFDILHEVWIFFKYIFCCLIEKCIDQAKNEVDRTYLWIIAKRASSTTTANAKCRPQESVRRNQCASITIMLMISSHITMVCPKVTLTFVYSVVLNCRGIIFRVLPKNAPKLAFFLDKLTNRT